MEEMWKTWKKDDTAPRSQLQNENGILRRLSMAMNQGAGTIDGSQ